MALPHSRLPARRRFLFAAGAAAVATLPAARIARACSPRTLRLGVLLPHSTRYPELAREFLAGFEAYAASDVARGRVAVVPIACVAGDASATVAAAVRATECRSVDVVAGFAGGELAARLAPALEPGAVPFVACDLGADFVRARSDSALLVRHSLGYWQANYAMGPWAAAHLGRRVLIATDFLESGHDVVYAFRRGFEAEGGEVVGVVRTGLPDGTGALPEVAAAVRSTVPDFVYAFYSGKRAQAFLHAYQAAGLAGATPLAGAAMLTERAGTAAFEGIVTAASWGPETAGPFGVLGYETAHRVAAGAQALDGATGNPRALARAITGAPFDGPRGRVVPDGELAEAPGPAYVRRRTQTAAGLTEVVIERLPAVELERAMRRELRTQIKTGWSQAYLTA
jgi:branched-chain amino acid transport system substrate-binding protein